MALRATCLDNGQEIDLDRADEPSMAGVLDELHRRTTRGDRPRPGRAVLECREHDDPDKPYHGAWVYLRRDRHGRWVLAHFDRDNYTDHVAAGMTDQHRWQQDYWQRAGDAAGYATAREEHLPGVRLDVAIYGPAATIGVEVQHSALSRRAVLTRTTKARGHGVTSLWSGDKPAAPPDWAYRVPTVLTNELPERYAPRGTWTVVNGLRTLVPTRCAQPRFHDSSYEGFGGICPATNRRSPCGGWHARFVPTFGVTVDDVAEQAPAGALIPLTLPHWRNPRVYIVTDADHELYGELATGTYTDPERATQDAAEASEVGEIGPCRVIMPHQAAAHTLSTAPDTTAVGHPASSGHPANPRHAGSGRDRAVAAHNDPRHRTAGPSSRPCPCTKASRAVTACAAPDLQQMRQRAVPGPARAHGVRPMQARPGASPASCARRALHRPLPSNASDRLNNS